MDFIPLFDQTKAAFSTHQSKSNGKHYPKALKEAAVSLLKYYPASVLSREFGISARSLSNWQRANSTQSKLVDPSSFIPITLNEVSTAAEPPMNVSPDSLILKCPHGLELILPSGSAKEAARFLCEFVREFSRCSI